MNTRIKRVAAIHDLSGFGRASLTVVIPVLSAMGVQVCPVPTAVLSTHTGGFTDYSFVDLTANMREFLAHWARLKLEFDCIYSGFLGSSQQIGIVSEFMDEFSGNSPLLVVDPVLGDNGQLYSAITPEVVKGMKSLVRRAHIITPNTTEVALLLGEEYREQVTWDQVRGWLLRLSDMGPEMPIITSVPVGYGPSKEVFVAAYDRKTRQFWSEGSRYIHAHYPGVGDMFTSVVVGSVLRGDGLPEALRRGVQFTTGAIEKSCLSRCTEREGVLFEGMLGSLTRGPDS